MSRAGDRVTEVFRCLPAHCTHTHTHTAETCSVAGCDTNTSLTLFLLFHQTNTYTHWLGSNRAYQCRVIMKTCKLKLMSDNAINIIVNNINTKTVIPYNKSVVGQMIKIRPVFLHFQYSRFYLQIVVLNHSFN